MKVKFVPQNIELEIKPNQSVMELAHENGIEIKSVCNGMPSCAECRVRVVDGEQNVLPPSNKELSLIGTGFFVDQRRLACQLICFGDIIVDLSEQIEKIKEGPRRPQGSIIKSETEQSYAVTGNLIEDDSVIKDEVKIQEVDNGIDKDKVDSKDKGFYRALYNGKKTSKKSENSNRSNRSRNRNRGRNRRR